MAKRCSELLLEELAKRGVDQLFGIPGNHTVPLYRGFAAASIRHITSRHEQGAAFMADGYARMTGRPGVCILISGPGLLNAATAMAQALADSVPMLVITGVAARSDLGMRRGTLHELPDQAGTAASFCRESHTLLDPENLPNLLARAFAIFQSGRPGPVHIEIPLDLMEVAVEGSSASTTQCFPPGPDPGAIALAAQRLQSASRPLLLVGGGARKAAAELTMLAQALDAPVLNTVNGKGICPQGHPLSVGGSPSLPCLRRALLESDQVLAIGTELAETDYDLLLSGSRIDISNWIRIDIDSAQLLIPAEPALAITSDSTLACQALLQTLEHAPAAARNGALRAASLRAQISEEQHYHPEMQAFFNAITEAIPEVTLIGDSTRPTYYASWQFETRAPGRYFHSVSGFGTLGYALPAALGARAADKGPVVALIGDGGLQFTLPELITGADAELGVPVIVWNNSGYAEISSSMRAAQVSDDSTRILTPDFRHAASAHHCHYANPRTLPDLVTVLKKAISAAVPTLIEVQEADFLTTPAGDWYPDTRGGAESAA